MGIGDAGAVSLLPEARAAVEAAELLCGGERHLGFFPDHPAERLVLRANVGEVVERLRSERRRAVVLASGDPDCYGIGPILAKQLGADRVRILPNVGAVQLACARLGIAWHDAAILSAHGRPLDGIFPAVLRARTAVVLTDDRNTPAALARALLAAGAGQARLDVFEHLGGPRERHVGGCPAEIAGQAFAPLNTVVVRHDGPPPPLALGLPEDAYAHRAGQITKAEVRVISLSQLRLHERSVVWDVGAGCGSVAIEAAALARAGKVFAIERDPTQIELLRENARRHAAGNVVVVEGAAPEALGGLPEPDAVFVGGSGGALAAIAAAAMARLRPGGRLVANLATLEHLAELGALARPEGWPCEVTQVAVARSVPVADLTRLAALNPVFVVTLRRSGAMA